LDLKSNWRVAESVFGVFLSNTRTQQRGMNAVLHVERRSNGHRHWLLVYFSPFIHVIGGHHDTIFFSQEKKEFVPEQAVVDLLIQHELRTGEFPVFTPTDLKRHGIEYVGPIFVPTPKDIQKQLENEARAREAEFED